MEIHKLRGTESLVDLESGDKKNLVETGLVYFLLSQQPEKLALKIFQPPIGLGKQDLAHILIKVSGIKNMVLYFLFVRWN